MSAMDSQDQQLLDLLLDRGLLKPEQLEQVKSRAESEQKAVIEIIQEQRLVFPEVLAQVISEVLDIPYVDLSKTEVDAEAMKLIPRKAAVTYHFVAFSKQENVLKVAMSSPEDFQAREALKFITRRHNLSPEIYIASAQAIDTVLGGSSAVEAEIGGAITEFSQELEEAKQFEGKDIKSIEKIIEEAPVTKVVAVVIRHAIEGHASDIHIEPTEKELRVRYRIDGQLHTTLVLPLKVHAAVISRIKILSNLKIDEQRLPQDGRFSVSVDKNVYDFRVATMPTSYGEKTALRILDKSAGAPSFEDLGLRSRMKELFQQELNTPHGIILISGPTGAGKSTTLFSALSQINRPEVNIVTLEDPIEYQIEGINQTQVHPDIGLSFATGLRNILRQDPDIIMVGEIRDQETGELAVHASLTGHLVLSTIHTNDAVGTIPRLADMGIDLFLLAASLRLLVAQRLVSRICQHCQKEVKITGSLQEMIMQELASIPEHYKTSENQRQGQVLYESEGCPQCQERGTSGRLAIFEVVEINRAMRAAMNEEADYDTLKRIAQEAGAITMRQDGILKALEGQVRIEDVLRVTSETEKGNIQLPTT